MGGRVNTEMNYMLINWLAGFLPSKGGASVVAFSGILSNV